MTTGTEMATITVTGTRYEVGGRQLSVPAPGRAARLAVQAVRDLLGRAAG
jgi:hypothetical protein